MMVWSSVRTPARRRLLLTTILSGAVIATTPALAQVLPSGGKVTSGTAVISQPSSSQTTIAQSSGKAIITWNDFSIGQGGSVQFNNGSGATLNRVTGGDLSSIDGLLSATGSVYLINPNGVVIGKSGVVKTGGSFVASTLDLSDSNFLSGGDLSFTGSSTASVVNLGSVGSLGGNVVLIGSTVENDGSLTAANGTAGLAAGHSVLLKDTATDLGLFTVAVGGSGTSVTNTGSIAAASAELRANDGSIYALAGNTTGLITATGVGTQDGHIWLTAGDSGNLTVNEALKATRANGDGGTVETSAGTVDFAGVKVDTSGTTGKTGNWLVDPYDLTVDATAAGTISSNLNTTNVTLQTTASGTSGPGTANPSGVGDINIDSAISWSSANTLTLDAYHGINIFAPITVSGAGGVVLKTNDGGTGGDYSFGLSASGFAGNIQFTGTANTGQSLTINGTSYTLLYSMSDLANLTFQDGNYALAVSQNASGPSYSNSVIGPFNGSIEGLGNTISNLAINGNDADTGFISSVGAIGTIRDLGLVGGTITMGTQSENSVGALVGNNGNDTLLNDYSTATVSAVFAGTNVYGSALGGLVGWNGGSIVNSWASGTIESQQPYSTANAYNGGLVGTNYGTIKGSWASGALGINDLNGVSGGLVGYNYNAGGTDPGTISNSYATGEITVSGANVVAGGQNLAGGLIGYDSAGTITSSWAGGNIIGFIQSAGGLVGQDSAGTISNSYALGSVTSSYNGAELGGLAGEIDTTAVTDVYAIGAVSGTGTGDKIGGVIGQSFGGTLAGAYYDYQTTGAASGTQTDGSIGLSTSQFDTASNFSGWTFTTTAGGTGWVIVDADGTLNNAGNAAGATRPMLASEYSTTIDNAHQLQLIALNLAGNYTVDGTIDMSATENAGGLWDAGGFVALGGSSATPFSGTISGGVDAELESLTLRGNGTYVGLVGYNTGTISDLSINGFLVNSSGYTTGALVGWNAGTVIGDILVAGLVEGTGGSSHLGGLVGVNASGGVVTASTADGTVDASTYTVGGLVGYNAGTLNGDSFGGSVTGSGSQTGGLVALNWGGTLGNDTASGTVTGSAGYGVGGLAGYNNGTISGSVSSATVHGSWTSQAIGDLAGYSEGTITDDYATGSVAGLAATQSVGDLIGWSDGYVSNVYATGNVSSVGASSHVGGLMGVNNNGATLSYAYETGSVSGNGNDVGGLLGYNSGYVTQTYAMGSVSGSATFQGGLIGYAPGNVNSSYWDTTTSDKTSAVGAGSASATGLTTAQFASTSSLSDFDFTTTAGGTGWVIVDTDGSLNNAGGAGGAMRPVLASEYSTTITNAHQLELIAMNLAGTYTLGSNIDLSATSGTSGLWITSEGFAPIGAGSTHFSGSLNGNGYTIGNLSLTGAGNYAGLFGYNTGTISNVDLTASISTSAYATGALVGWNDGTLNDDEVSGTISGGGSHIGGMAGVNTGTVESSNASMTITSSAYSSGGLVGYNSGEVSEDWFLGTVTATGTLAGGLVAFNVHGTVTDSSAVYGTVSDSGEAEGGLVGWNEGGTVTDGISAMTVSGSASHAGGLLGVNDEGTVSGSYATGTVTASGADAGGLVAYNSGSLSYDYATGAVTGSAAAEGGLVGWNQGTTTSIVYASGAVMDTAAAAHVGGLIGANLSGTLSDAYATGAVSGAGNDTGGLVGYNNATIERVYATGAVSGTALYGGALIGYNAGTLTSGYWDTTVAGSQAGIGGGTTTGASGLTTATLQGALPAGFSASTWSLAFEHYPYLTALGSH